MTARTKPITAARIRTLAEAYGAEPSRWPEAERTAALDWIAAHPREAMDLLDGAGALDSLLDAWRLPQPAEALRTRILAPAPAVLRDARRRSFLLTLGGGAGLAAACLAGILAAPALVSPPSRAAAPVAVAQALTDEEVLSEVLAGWEAPVGDPADPAS